jgi:DNA repair exonuclease SbcCD ATPase subunit
MDSSQQSSNRTNDYSSTLIGTVAELRMELQRTMSEIQSTKDQNRSLQSNNQAIKDELLETRKKYGEAYENYMATVTEKLEAERQNEAFMERLKKQLLEKTREFDQMRDKNSPQDIDTIRIKVQEELEIPHHEKMMKVQNELQDQRSRTYEMKREFDLLKTDFEVMTKSYQRDIEALKEQHEQVRIRVRSVAIVIELRVGIRRRVVGEM